MMDKKPSDCQQYEIRRATEEDRVKLFEFIKKIFFTDEPLRKALNDLGRQRPVTTENCTITGLEDDLSFVAVANSGEIVAFIQNAILRPRKPYDFDSNFDEEQVIRLIDHIEEQLEVLAKPENSDDLIFQVRTLTVDEAWRKKGIARILLQKSREIAKEKGFKQMRVVCTSAFSAELFSKCEFECVYALKYEDWKNEGKLDFLPYSPHLYAKGMILIF